MMRSYYSEKFSKFLTDSDDVILGTLLRNDPRAKLTKPYFYEQKIFKIIKSITRQ